MDISRKGTWGPMEHWAQGRGQCLGKRSPGAGRARSCSSAHQWAANRAFCHVLDRSPRGTAAVATEAEGGLLHLGRENQRVSNSHQTNRRIMMGINHRVSGDPRPGEGGGQ